MILSLWAPGAKSVDLVLTGRRVALQSAGGGQWRVDIAESELTAGYRYSIDGGAPLPDPRSRWQPAGVHGASHLVEDFAASQDPGAAEDFRAKPLEEAIIYELHIGTFTPEGTYVAAQNKLVHLVELGVTHLELMPLATFPGQRGWGYDGVDLFAPFPAYGTPRQLAAFVRACHSQGLAVLLDVVYNHLGPDGNYLGQFAPYFTDAYKTPWGAAVNYDGPDSDEVRRFVIDNALMWLKEYGFDGLRLDAVHAICSFGATHILEELSAAVRQLSESSGRSFVLIAESDLNDPRLVRSPAQGGYGLDAQWADDFHHALHRYFTGESGGYYADFRGLGDVATALRDAYVYQGQPSVFRGRRHGRPPAGMRADQLVVCAQNHDQIGNRAHGERLSQLLGVAQLKAVAALTLLSPFVPLLFQGEEWGAKTPFVYFTDHENVELGRLVAEGRSREFAAFQWQGAIPNPQDSASFTRSKLNWSELAQPAHAELFEWHRRLIELRRTRAAKSRGRGLEDTKARIIFDEEAGHLSFSHQGILAVFNFSPRAQYVPLPSGEWELLLRSDPNQVLPAGVMPAETTFIYAGTPSVDS